MATIDAPAATGDTAAKPVDQQWLGRNASKAVTALQYLWFMTVTLGLKAINLTVPRRFSLVETTPFIDPTQFEWHEHITSEISKVQAELKTLLSAPEIIPNHQDIIETIASISNDDKWLSYFFYIYGQRFDKQCNECPDTARLLQNIPGMKTAFFSILSPGKTIPPHRGPYQGVMRYHLPLLVPQHGECGIRVGDQTASFHEGMALMFDDTYEHEVWNQTEETRVVLFLDIMRPMKFPFNKFNSAMMALMGKSPVVRRMQKRQSAFDRTLADRRVYP
ncbi:aspartyl/asparaginyl beta-hydroxylase domain-containing protein [Mycobacterium europaeum]|uniref:aspartyl/asparaginyl beta-hydroxylase domain-containing protein n=1 Tax=Mycobacterium europaeum TaxID=761804 RepID=UPI001301CF46|nr:aspartyl/asparaginyl beta-hydroxylase domain-containing protein [Mycobacterium europaeum]